MFVFFQKKVKKEYFHIAINVGIYFTDGNLTINNTVLLSLDIVGNNNGNE